MLRERQRAARRQLFPGGEAALESLTAAGRDEARRAAELILAAHHTYLETFDAITAMRDEGRTLIGGFHSPMEWECLVILLRGRQPAIWVPARSIVGMWGFRRS